MSNGSMKTRLQKLGMAVWLMMLPMMATSASAQQWTAPSQSSAAYANIGDSVVETPGVAKAAHTIVLTDRGTLMGQVNTIDANTKSANGLQGHQVFFVQNGQIIKQVETEIDGSFKIHDMPEGAYSFFAAGPSGFAASGVYIARRNWGKSTLLEATVASTSYRGIQQITQTNIPIEIQRALATVPIREDGGAVTTAKQVRLLNGRISGQISSLFGRNQDLAGIQIHLIQNDQPIAQVQTDAQGEFIIPDVAPGVYDFVAAGRAAIVVGRFEAIGNASLMTQASFRKTAIKLEYAFAELNEPVNAVNREGEIIYQDGADALMEQAPNTVEYSGETVSLGGVCGGCAGNTGNYSNISSGPAVRGGGIGRGGVGFRRLLLLGGVVGGVVGGTAGNPGNSSPIDP